VNATETVLAALEAADDPRIKSIQVLPPGRGAKLIAECCDGSTIYIQIAEKKPR